MAASRSERSEEQESSETYPGKICRHRLRDGDDARVAAVQGILPARLGRSSPPGLQLLVTAGSKSAAMVTALVHSRPHRSTP